MTVKVKAVRIERWTDLLARLRARPSVEYDSQWADRYEPGIAKQAGAVRENLGRLGLLHPDAVACSVDVAIHDALLRVRAAARAQEGKA
jgi:hypothetical protein